MLWLFIPALYFIIKQCFRWKPQQSSGLLILHCGLVMLCLPLAGVSLRVTHRLWGVTSDSRTLIWVYNRFTCEQGPGQEELSVKKFMGMVICICVLTTVVCFTEQQSPTSATLYKPTLTVVWSITRDTNYNQMHMWLKVPSITAKKNNNNRHR